MEQGNLFASPVVVAIERAMRAPIAAKQDPVTSQQAARYITKSGKREGQLLAVLSLVMKYPRRTAVELAARSTFDRYTVNRRLPELEHAGLIRKAGQRPCEIHKRLATIWEAF
jgi:CRP-like cAMP-binding protein